MKKRMMGIITCMVFFFISPTIPAMMENRQMQSITDKRMELLSALHDALKAELFYLQELERVIITGLGFAVGDDHEITRGNFNGKAF